MLRSTQRIHILVTINQPVNDYIICLYIAVFLWAFLFMYLHKCKIVGRIIHQWDSVIEITAWISNNITQKTVECKYVYMSQSQIIYMSKQDLSALRIINGISQTLVSRKAVRQQIAINEPTVCFINWLDCWQHCLDYIQYKFGNGLRYVALRILSFGVILWLNLLQFR